MICVQGKQTNKENNVNKERDRSSNNVTESVSQRSQLIQKMKLRKIKIREENFVGSTSNNFQFLVK